MNIAVWLYVKTIHVIPDNTLALLEFHKVLMLIADYANSGSSRDAILRIVPLNTRGDIESRLNVITDIRRLAAEGTPLSLRPFTDISHHLSKIRPEGAVLDAAELADFIPVFDMAAGIGQSVRERFDLPWIRRLAAGLTGFPEILKALLTSIDGEGNILDSASFHLADIRDQIRKLEARIRKKLEEFTRDERVSSFLQDDFVTMRSGRWVIPVRMDSKGMVPGVIHDVSKSGETAFIEPLAIINLSNELENLIADQKAEELRILRSLCSAIRGVIEECEREFSVVVYLDVLNSIARFADALRMENPVIGEASRVRLVSARHPLLELSLRRSNTNREIIPLDIELGQDYTVMVITGANAGGKTIAIKTIGLIMLMALSGMPVPAASSSTIPFVSNLLVDIGDEQSIENNLSTFSAHMLNLSDILKNREPDMVILIDELGTGTDPAEGTALACSILGHLRRSGALVFATTHLSDIKSFVHRTEGMLNASMEFDQETFTPLYRLRVGEPGQSHALDIAQRYGIPESVITEARGMLGTAKTELDRVISDLHEKRIEYERALHDIRIQRDEWEQRNKMLTQVLGEAQENRRKILANAYHEASGIIDDTKRQMNYFLDEVKRREKSERRRLIKDMENFREKIVAKRGELDPAKTRRPSPVEIREGETVFVHSLGRNVPVISLNKKEKRVRVSAGSVEIEVPFADISFANGKSHGAVPNRFMPAGTEKTVPVKISLIGLRVDEALSRLERFLNDAALSDLTEVVIIHGIGKGFLSKAIHAHLEGHPLVRSFRSGKYEEGGPGITFAVMR